MSNKISEWSDRLDIGIIRKYENYMGDHSEYIYVVVPMVEGETITQLVDRVRLNPNETIMISVSEKQ